MYLAASTRSQVATAQHGDHGFLKYRILCPDIRDPIAVPFHHFKKMWQHGNHSSFFHEFLGSNDKGNGGIWQAQMTKGMAAYIGPVAPGVGDRPLSPVGGRQGLFFQGTSLRIWRKKITLKACRPMGGDRGYFWNISKRTYIFEIFIFKKYKKEKTAWVRWLALLSTTAQTMG